MGLDPADVRDYAIIGAETMLDTGKKFTSWAEQMGEATGLEISDLRTIWKDSTTILKEDRARGRRIYARSKAISGLLSAVESQPALSADDAVTLSRLVSQVRESVGEVQIELAQELAAALGAMEDPSIWAKVRSVQTMAQLLNAKTLLRNLIGNELFWTLERTSRIVATGADIVVNNVTGRPRTVTFRGAGRGGYREYYSGLKRGSRAAWKGQDPYGLGGKFDMPSQPSFSGPGWVQQVAEKALDRKFEAEVNVPAFMERVLGVALRGFDFAAFERQRVRYLAEQGWLAGEREGLEGDKLRAYVDNYIVNADQLEADVQEASEQAGLYVTFQDDTRLSETAVALKGTFNRLGFTGKDGQVWGVGDLVVKYPKTPANLFARALDYSPYGYGESLATMLAPWQRASSEATVNQEQALMQLSRATIGTLGLLPLGWYLFEKGVLTDSGPDDDEARRLLREEGGMPPYSVNVSALWRLATTMDPASLERRRHDRYYEYNWLMPLSINLMIGANIAGQQERAQLKGDRTAGAPELDYWNLAAAAIRGSIEAMQENPVLTALTAINPRDMLGSASRVAISAPASFFPTGLKQLAESLDPVRREAYRGEPLQQALNQALQKLPWVREMVPPQYPTLGERDDEGVPRYRTGEDGRLIPIVEPIPSYGGAEELTGEDAGLADLALHLFNTFVAPGRSSVYDPDPMVGMLIGAYEATGSTQAMPRRQERKMPVQRGAGTYKVTLRAEDFADLQKRMAEEITIEMARFDPELVDGLDPEQQIKVLYTAINRAAARVRNYWFNNLAYKYTEEIVQ